MANRFPHLLPHERRVWERFLTVAPMRLDSLEYDRRLGEGIPLDPSWPEWVKVSARALTQKRVDVIGRSGPETWLFEVKVRAGSSALGQLLTYALLYMAEERPVNPPRLAVVCESVMSDIGLVLANYRIHIFVV